MSKNLLVLMFIGFSMTGFSQKLDWYFHHPINQKLVHLGEKGSIQEALINSGELPDPFYGENESKFQWIEKYKWTIFCDFELHEAQLLSPFIEINFPAIDTYAEIFINDSLVGFSENAFHPYSFQVKDYLILGKNSIKLVFTPPTMYHKQAFNKLKTKYPAPNDIGEIAVAPMSRKPQYQFGWDWAPRINTIGLWQEVSLYFYDYNRILNASILTEDFDVHQATLTLKIDLIQKVSQTVIIKSALFGEFKVKIHHGSLKQEVTLPNPQLWWPRGHGLPILYTDNVEIFDLEGKLIDSQKIKFGIRKTELIQEKDLWGTSFYFKINGKKIFCKGANYIPQDIFPSRVNDRQISDLVEQAYQSNFNMIRVCGGGYYPDEIFYKSCDEKGILVWQDLMFACAMYPGDDAFLKNVKNELEYQIPRIAGHPSVIYFNGNNEVDVAWKNWGFQLQYLIGRRKQRQMEQDYKDLFQNLAPKIIRDNCKIPYVHTSPLSNWSKEEGFNNGTMHYWGVWHGRDPIEDFGLKVGRFNAEYGFQSFPEYATLKSFSLVKDWDLNSSVMKAHQKSYVGNGMIKKHADFLYGKAENFKEFVYFSQLTQAKAVGIAIAGHRSQQTKSSGTLYWQLNDCWPAPTWSSIDYQGNWKALQYQVKKDFEDVGIIERHEKDGVKRYFFISDLDENFTSEIKYSIKDLKGNNLLKSINTINSDGVWLQEICSECQSLEFIKQNYVLEIEWNNHLGELKKRIFFHEIEAFEKAKTKNISMQLESINVSNKTAQLRIENKQFVADFWIFSENGGIQFDRNFENLLPGIHIFTINFVNIPKLSDFDFIYR